jgi:hypothetical protein
VTVRRRLFERVASSCALAVAVGGVPAHAVVEPRAAAPANVAELVGRLPADFEANQGQVEEEVKFFCRAREYDLFLTPAEAVLSLRGARQEPAVVRMRLVGGNPASLLAGEDLQAGTSNYFLGGEPSRWHTGIAHYSRVRARNVYPGVDLVYRTSQRRLEYDLVVGPGADPRRIRLAFSGVRSARLGAGGELILHTAAGDLVQPAPTAYQVVGSRRRTVESRYVLPPPAGRRGRRVEPHAPRQVAFALGRYDRTRPLIIDPVMVSSTFFGGSGDDQGFGIALDGAGNIYVAGRTTSASFPLWTGTSIQPAGGGSADAFVLKLNPTATAIAYLTFLGGSKNDEADAIAVDGAGNAYIAGEADSADFPVTAGNSLQPAYGGGFSDGFVAKINSTGTALLYSTYLGGSDLDYASGIAIDAAGNAYVVGATYSASFPGVTRSSLQPALGGGNGNGFITKINAAGTAVVYSTYFGGKGNDAPVNIAVDRSGSAYVGGFTSSDGFPGVTGASIQPARGGGYDAFVSKIDPGGTAIVYSTYLGGTGDDIIYGIAVDGTGNAYVTGSTSSPTFPGVTGSSIQPVNRGGPSLGPFDAFVTKINAAGSAIVYSTFFGGSDWDQGSSIAVDSAGNAYVAGFTSSPTLPGVTGDSIQGANAGTFDAFVTKIDAAGTSILYTTLLGGILPDDGYSIALDRAGNAYVTGDVDSATFPGVTASSLQPHNAGGTDLFVTRLALGTAPPCVDTATSVCLGNQRFAVSATWTTPDGRSGTAQVVKLTPDTAYLWFFASANVEAVVKVIDGCALNHHFWFFAGGLTDVNVVLAVTDVQAGTTNTYINPPHTPFKPIQDTSAFATCT